MQGHGHSYTEQHQYAEYVHQFISSLFWRNSGASPEVFFPDFIASVLLTWMLVVLCWQVWSHSTIGSCVGFLGRYEGVLSVLHSSCLWACWKQGALQEPKLEPMHFAPHKVRSRLCEVQEEHVQVCLWKPPTHPLKTASLWMHSLTRKYFEVLVQELCTSTKTQRGN